MRQYLELLDKIMKEGAVKGDRTGTCLLYTSDAADE